MHYKNTKLENEDGCGANTREIKLFDCYISFPLLPNSVL